MTTSLAPDTPAVVIDLPIVERNIERAQKLLDGLGIAFRPHIKTHKLPFLARKQLEAGAVGINCQKIGEAEVMAESGIRNILITYNILGEDKLVRLRRLAGRCELSVTADSTVVVEGLSRTFKDTTPLNVLVECDTGAGRCGVQSPQHAAALARSIADAPGLKFQGLMTYPAPHDLRAVDGWLSQARSLLTEAGLQCAVVSSGGTPNLALAGQIPTATEHRAGTYIYNDRSLVERGACTIADCALSVVATIVSRPTEHRAIIDAGSKMLTSDLLGMSGYGLIPSAPGAVIVSLSEEHGIIDVSRCNWKPEVGDVVSIIPNHACVVTNMVDTVHIKKADGSMETLDVAARGLVS